MHVFGLREETRVTRENPHRHGETMYCFSGFANYSIGLPHQSSCPSRQISHESVSPCPPFTQRTASGRKLLHASQFLVSLLFVCGSFILFYSFSCLLVFLFAIFDWHLYFIFCNKHLFLCAILFPNVFVL